MTDLVRTATEGKIATITLDSPANRNALSSVLLPPGMTRVIVIGLAVVMMLAGIFVVFWMLLRWTLSIPASVMENLGVHRALKRSSILTKGGIGRIFVMLLLVVAITVVIQYAIQIPMFFLLWKSRGVPTLSTQIAASLGGSFSGAFVLPIYSIALTLFYYDQRIRKEGYDVEWMLEHSTQPGSPVPPELLPGPTHSRDGADGWNRRLGRQRNLARVWGDRRFRVERSFQTVYGRRRHIHLWRGGLSKWRNLDPRVFRVKI